MDFKGLNFFLLFEKKKIKKKKKYPRIKKIRAGGADFYKFCISVNNA